MKKPTDKTKKTHCYSEPLTEVPANVPAQSGFPVRCVLYLTQKASNRSSPISAQDTPQTRTFCSACMRLTHIRAFALSLFHRFWFWKGSRIFPKPVFSRVSLCWFSSGFLSIFYFLSFSFFHFSRFMNIF